MTIIEKIDQLISEVGKEPLSQIIPQAYSIAIDLEAYKLWVMLQLNMFSSDEGKLYKSFKEQQKQQLCRLGLTELEVKEILDEVFMKFLHARSIADGKIFTFSVQEIENSLKSIEDAINEIKLPDGLNPIDAYFKSDEQYAQKLKLINGRKEFENQYEISKTIFTSELIEMRHKAKIKESQEFFIKNVTASKNVFIIHGRNEARLFELKEILKFTLNPIILKDQPNQGLTIIEKFEKYANTLYLLLTILLQMKMEKRTCK